MLIWDSPEEYFFNQLWSNVWNEFSNKKEKKLKISN